MVIVSGFNVYPNEIAGMVYRHPDIVACAAIGAPDDKTGEAVILSVVSFNPQLTESEILGFGGAQLAAFKVRVW